MYICCMAVRDKISCYYDDTATDDLNKAIQHAKEIYDDVCDTTCFIDDELLNTKICVLNKLTFEFVYQRYIFEPAD